jgi:hypothetical protein
MRVTHRTRTIDGAPTVVVSDLLYLRGKLEERTRDYYTQDSDGNVWYFGEDTAELGPGGRVKTREGTWHAGVDGAKPGIFMYAEPRSGRSARRALRQVPESCGTAAGERHDATSSDDVLQGAPTAYQQALEPTGSRVPRQRRLEIEDDDPFGRCADRLGDRTVGRVIEIDVSGRGRGEGDHESVLVAVLQTLRAGRRPLGHGEYPRDRVDEAPGCRSHELFGARARPALPRDQDDVSDSGHRVAPWWVARKG